MENKVSGRTVPYILGWVMVIVAVVFLVLMFVVPGEIQIGAFVASILIAAVFFWTHKRSS